MESILRALAVYVFLLILLRVTGKRTLDTITTFDLILILIMGDALQQGLLGEDYSLTNAALVVITLVFIDIAFSLVKQQWSSAEKWIDGVPAVLIVDGKARHETMIQNRVDEADILEAARKFQGLERLDQIKYAVLEKSGGITVIPRQKGERRKSKTR
jgi:uncharacterized membrane protein YcaP (DUF421 family)